MSTSAVELKWDLRMQAAKTQEQRSAVAGSDTGNRAFSIVIMGPLEDMVSRWSRSYQSTWQVTVPKSPKRSSQNRVL